MPQPISQIFTKNRGFFVLKLLLEREVLGGKPDTGRMSLSRGRWSNRWQLEVPVHLKPKEPRVGSSKEAHSFRCGSGQFSRVVGGLTVMTLRPSTEIFETVVPLRI